MEEWDKPSPDCCSAAQEFYAVYVRRSRHQTFSQLACSPFSHLRGLNPGKALPQLRLRLGVIGLALLSIGTAIQPSSATPESPWQGRGHAVLNGAEIGEVAWSNYLATGLNCRSRFNGSSADVVRQVKARIAGPGTFIHIETTIWPRKSGEHDLTMMFRTGSGQNGAIVREARATVNPETCRARVLSIS